MNKKERLIQAFSLLLSLSMVLSACASEAPATSEEIPKLVETATAELEGGVPTHTPAPTREYAVFEGNEHTLDIQSDCREHLANTSLDVCMGFTEFDGQFIWTGVLSEEYEPNTRINVYAYNADNSTSHLFGVTTGSEGEFAISQERFNLFITSLYLVIGENNTLAGLRQNVSGDHADGRAMYLFEKISP